MRTGDRISVMLAVVIAAGASGHLQRSASASQRAAKAPNDRQARAIAALDDCIQTRFKDVDQGFGFTRMIKPGATPHRFEPENVREIDMVSELEGAGLRVVLYLTGRRVLGPMPASDAPADPGRRRIIKGPVQIWPVTSHDAESLAPAPRDLWDESRRALLAFGERNSHEFTTGGWTVAARPVRASDVSCLDCHGPVRPRGPLNRAHDPEPLKLGDAIGVVMYAYRPAR